MNFDNVMKVIERLVNPALNMHGGFIKLEKVEGNKIYVIMGGGCQGCAASHITLKSGVENLLKEEFPELEEVVDVTDHNNLYVEEYNFEDNE